MRLLRDMVVGSDIVLSFSLTAGASSSTSRDVVERVETLSDLADLIPKLPLRFSIGLALGIETTQYLSPKTDQSGPYPDEHTAIV